MPILPNPRHGKFAQARAKGKPASKRIRGRKGQEIRRRRLLRTSYLCEMCQAKGTIRIADEVDHIVPLDHGGEDIDENTRNLCREHHLDVTAEVFGHRKRVTIGDDGWPVERS